MIDEYDAYQCYGPCMIAEYDFQLKSAMKISVHDYGWTTHVVVNHCD